MLTQDQINWLKSLADDMKKATGLECGLSIEARTDEMRFYYTARVGKIMEAPFYAVSEVLEDAIAKAIAQNDQSKAVRIATLESQLAALKGA